MKPIRQLHQDYIGLDLRLESVLDAMMYHPIHQRRRRKKYLNGKTLMVFRRLRGITRKKYGKLTDLKLYACGVSHLDAAWLYPVVDTKERAFKTFYKAVEHCAEFPFFRFAMTSPQYYDWIRCYSPSLWAQVKELVKKGQIEITGGMWIEPDLDMPCGESLVRQRLYGQLFYLREFDKMPSMESLLDVFGFPWSIPQILLKSGAKTFWTTKCAGSTPFTFFKWRGLDGSEIFTFQFTYNWDALSSTENFRRKSRFPASQHNHAIASSHNSRQEIESWFSKVPKDFNHHFPLFYGIGDGGRGPMEVEIMFADTLMQLHHGYHITQHEYMNIAQKVQGDRYFIWNDEMFLHMHHGTKTTQSEIKHLHRRAEVWIIAAEKLATILGIGAPRKFNLGKAEWFGIWQKILFNEFHDILPGSSIPDVYILAKKELADAGIAAQNWISSILRNISVKNGEILVYNPFNWVRSEYCEYNGQLGYISEVLPLSVQKILLTDFLTKNKTQTIQESKDKFILENQWIRATVLKAGGHLYSLIYKPLNYDLLEPAYSLHNQGSGFRAFHDNPRSRWKAWDIDKQYHLHRFNIIPMGNAQITARPNGEQVIRITYNCQHSQFTIDFGLRSLEPFLRLWIHTEMQDNQMMVKYFLPINLVSEDVTSEIPYGVISRKRIKRTDGEKLKWETAMQQWLDISDSTVGLTVANNNRYGFSATRRGIYLTLSRTAEYPGISPLYGSTRLIPPKKRPKYTDLGSFDYEFALIPHDGSWKSNHTWQYAFNFNLPLICASGITENETSTEQEACKDQEASLFECSSSNILVGALKPSEWIGKEFSQLPYPADWQWDGRSFICRLVEQEGMSTQCVLKFNSAIRVTRVEEIDLLEMQPLSIVLKDSTHCMLNFSPFEIKTLRICCEKVKN